MVVWTHKVDTGYVKLWRKSIGSRVFQNEALLKVWVWCLLKASHKDRWVTMKTGRGESEVFLKAGQFVYGRKSAAKELKMKPSSIRNRMEKLKKLRNLDTQPDTHYTVVTICNWELYQGVEKKEDTKKDRHRTTKGQPKDTNKKVKNVKNVKKNIYGEFQNVLLTTEEYSKLETKFNSTLQERIEKLSEYMASKGKQYKSHYATILSWSRKDTQTHETFDNPVDKEKQAEYKAHLDKINQMGKGTQ